MSNTVFAAGADDPGRILRDVERGYYLAGHRIPSIAESRENFRISARRVYEIRNGELGRLYRDGGIMSDTRDYLTRIDGVGTDFRLFPIPNCGKGQPMQTKRLGNGGPTMRSRARRRRLMRQPRRPACPPGASRSGETPERPSVEASPAGPRS
jgi:TldD protein